MNEEINESVSPPLTENDGCGSEGYSRTHDGTKTLLNGVLRLTF